MKAVNRTAHRNEVETSWRCRIDGAALRYHGLIWTACCHDVRCLARLSADGPFAACGHAHADRWDAIDCARAQLVLLLLLVQRHLTGVRA